MVIGFRGAKVINFYDLTKYNAYFFVVFLRMCIFCSTFASKLFWKIVRRIKYILPIFLLLLSSMLMAEVVVLRSGQRVQGEIVVRNSEVVIVRTSNGMRYQYPMSEVSAITLDEDQMAASTEKKDNVSRKQQAVSLRAQTMGGALYVPNMGWGGYAGADLIVGANVMEGKRVFVGGGVGYRARVVNGKTYSFIPLQATISSSLMYQQHSPIIGMNIGYGISTDRKIQGGICAGAELGWHYVVDENTSIVLGLSAEWQQARADVVEIVINPETHEQKDYINHMGVNFITFGAKVAILF